ncbi:MAG: hypothetical protein ACKVZ6_15540 [Kineosporiaceae bacterium]
MTGPGRTVARTAAVLAALVGIVLLLTGVVRAGAAGDLVETTGGTAGLAGVAAVTTSADVLDAGASRVGLRASATSADRTVFIGVARADDVEAWLGDLGRVEVLGSGGDGRDGTEGVLDIARRDGAMRAPDPADADIWVASASGQGAAQLAWRPADGRWRAVVAGADAGDLERVDVTWTRTAGTSSAPAFIAVGLLLLVAGAVTLVVLRRRTGRVDDWSADYDYGDGGGDDDDPSGGGPAGSGDPEHAPATTSSSPRIHGRRRAGTPPGSLSRALGFALVGALAVTGCSGSGSDEAQDRPPTPAAGAGSSGRSTPGSSAPAGPAVPVVLVSQAEDVLDRVDAAAAEVARSGRIDAFGARAVGPYRERLAADLKTRAAATDATAATAARVVTGMSRDRLIVTSQSGWPRFFVVAGAAPGLPTPVVRVLRSDSARTPYGVWGEPVLLPGATLPEVAPAADGAAALPAGAAGLVASPQDVAPGYADTLTKGTSSPSARLFAPDEFRRQVTTRLDADRAGVTAVGTVASKHVVRPDGVLAFRTADGGAVVVASIEQTYTVTVRPGAGTVRVDRALAALGGRTSYSKALTRTSVQVVVFSVPASGGGPVRVIAASKGDVAVKGS